MGLYRIIVKLLIHVILSLAAQGITNISLKYNIINNTNL